MFRIALCVLTLLSTSAAFAQNNIDEKVMSALKSDIRTSAEMARDQNRKPLETLNFFRMKDNMRVLELVPGEDGIPKYLLQFLRRTVNCMCLSGPIGFRMDCFHKKLLTM